LLGALAIGGCPSYASSPEPDPQARVSKPRAVRLAAATPSQAPHADPTPTQLPSQPPKDPATDAAPRDLREPPKGASPAAARAFSRIPLAIHDGPPVGGIGQTGIHVDKIWLGSDYGKHGCEGKSDAFSVRAGEQVNVCFRAVHSRVEERVEVVWEKQSASTQRRRDLTIPPLHAYRTRAYLVLRGEYIGDWTVRILSEDQVELATASFTVMD